MWYTPYLRAKRAFQIYAIVLGIIVGIGLATRFWPGNHFHMDRGLEFFQIDGFAILTGCCVTVAFLATILGLSLAAENDGHLELAFTKPVSRERYALTVFGVDFVTIVLAIVLTFVISVAALDIFVGHQVVTFVGSSTSGISSSSAEHVHVRTEAIDTGREALQTLAYATFPLCMYAWVVALSASLRRNRGTIAGFLWPAFSILAAVQFQPIAAFRPIIRAVDSVNPLIVYTFSGGQPTQGLYWIGMLSIVVLLALAIVQWRRIEA